MDAQKYKRILSQGDPNILHKEFNGVKWVEEELERIKKNADLEQRKQEAERVWKICDNVCRSINNPPQGVNVNENYGLNHFKKLYEELKDLKNKNSQSQNNSSQQDSDDNIQNENNHSEYISCQQCSKEIKPRKNYWYHKTKNDDYKFCSTNCYDEYYGKQCNKCFEKFLTTYPLENNNYCSTCYEKVKQEESEEEEQSIRYCKYCSTKLVKEGNLKYSLRICDKDDCFLKLDKELYPNKYKNDNSNNPAERERERERDNNLTQQSTLRSQISTLESTPNKTPEQEAELEEKRRKLAELEDKLRELERKNKSDDSTETKPKSDKTPWLIGGGVVIIIILGIFILKRTRKRPVQA